VWKARRQNAIELAKGKCEVCLQECKKPTVDHIIPERFLRRYFAGKDPHHLINIIVCDAKCHGAKTGIDRRFWRGPDLVGFVTELGLKNWPMGRVRLAFEFYGIRISKYEIDAVRN